MGTKTNPGKVDNHAAAAADEPIFTLAASDPLARDLVGIYASLRLGETATASAAFERVIDTLALAYVRAPDWYHGEDALHTAEDMAKWRQAHGDAA